MQRYLREEYANNVAARACRFCGVNLSGQDAYDCLDESPGEAEGFRWTADGDVDEHICGLCWTKRNRAFEAFRAMEAARLDAYRAALEVFKNLSVGILQ